MQLTTIQSPRTELNSIQSVRLRKRKINKVTFIELDSAYNDFSTPTLMPRTYGMVVVATVVRNLGYDVKVYCEHISPIDMRRIGESDLVCFSGLTSAANKTFALADHIRRNYDVPMVFGGTFASYFADLCLEHVDYVIRNEGDETIVDLMRALEDGGSLDSIRGLSYRGAHGNVHNPARESVRDIEVIHDLSLVDGYDQKSQLKLLLTQRRIRWICLQASRGCPFSCNFCVAPVMYGRGYRMRTVDSVVADIKDKLRYGSYFLFVDNYFTANRKYVKQLLKRIIAEGIHASFSAFTRCEATEDDELMSLLKQAGFQTMYMGAESLSDDVLIRLNKHQTIEKVRRAIENIKRHGMMVTITFQAGNDEDDQFAVKRAVDFGLENDVDGVYFISAWSWPEDHKPVLDKQRMILKSLDYANGHFVTHFPMQMKPSTLQRSILDQQRRFWSPTRIAGFIRRGRWDRVAHLVMQRYALCMFEKPVREYVPVLERIEEGYYDRNERLDLEKIARRDLRYDGEFNDKYVGRLVGSYQGVEAGQLRPVGAYHP
ncbi:MAG TPA: radical SAM protein [Bryobacteraceae bacterium]|nr:radical SAM protein [Bryobacteraceae bacterium]